MVERAGGVGGEDGEDKGSCCIRSSYVCTLTKTQTNPRKNKGSERCYFF